MSGLNPEKTFFTSDIHFGHKNVIEYSNRPFANVEEMDRLLIENWNKTVPHDGTVFSLGDFCFGKLSRIKSILGQLNGTKFLIDGNHDKELIKGQQSILDEGLVQQITPYKEISVNGQFVVLFHYGCRVWNKAHHGSWLLYGHSHGSLPPYGKSVDVGVDAPFITGKAEYRPFSYKEIERFMSSRIYESVDHHKARE